MFQLFLAIGLVTLSIFVHELGHFLAARWRGMVVPRFSIFGIGKPIVSWKWRGVEYCICWLPIGAYVMVPQLSDLGDFEGDVPEEARNLPPAGYLSKVIVAVAGPTANILFALALACVVWAVGVKVPAEFNRTEVGEVAKEVVNTDGKTVPGPAFSAGLQTGDIIRSIDGKPVANFQDLITAIILGSQIAPDGRRVTEITLERNGAILTKQVYPELTGTESLRTVGLAPRWNLEPIVGTVNPDSPAALAGLQSGDRVISVDGKEINRRDELGDHFQKKHAEPSQLVYRRNGSDFTTSITPRLQTTQGRTAYLIGISWHIETVTLHLTPFEQIGKAVEQVYQTLSTFMNRNSDVGLRHASTLIGIVDNLQQEAKFGIIPAFAFLIAINVSLAILNLLPIPVLDGGHVMFATIAKLRGKPLSPALLQNAVAACFLLIIGLMVYIGYHDIRRMIQTRWSKPPPPAQTAPAQPAEPAK